MRKASTLIGLALVALSAPARAQDRAPAAAPPPATTAETAVAPASAVLMVPPAPPPRRIEIGLAFLPMGVGRFTTPNGALEVTGAASFAYGFGVSASYLVLRGLSVGLAPQVIYNVQDKVNPSQQAAPPAATQYDLMARVAYTLPIVKTIGLYGEALPGYSIIAVPGASPPKGPVLGLGGGVVMGLGDQAFAILGAGYQLGYQSVSVAGAAEDYRTRYLRVVLGGGVRL